MLPGPAPKEGDEFPPNKTYYEIPIAIQDRSFNADGSLFYPDTRAFFDGISRARTSPTPTSRPIWNPEFFGNTIMVNGNTWPFQTVEQRRYRFRFLNGCQSRFLILDFGNIPGVEVWQIGNEGGFLAGAGQPHGGQRQPAADGPGRARRRDRRLHQRARGQLRPRQRRPGRALRRRRSRAPTSRWPTRRRPARSCSSGSVPAVAPDPTTPPQFLVLPAHRAAPGGDGDPTAGAARDDVDVLRRTRRRKRCWAPSTAIPARARSVRPSDVDGARHREPERRRHGGLGVLQHHRRRPPDAHPRGDVRGGEPPGHLRRTRRPGRSRSSPARRRGRPSPGRPASRTPSSPTRARSRGSGRSSPRPASTSGTATSSSTRTTR